MKTSDNKVVSAIASIMAWLFAIPFVIAVFAMDGWILSIMWNWFMAPIFTIPRLSTATAIGISATIGMITYQVMPNAVEKEQSGAMVLLRFFNILFIRPLTVLFVGWVVRHWM